MKGGGNFECLQEIESGNVKKTDDKIKKKDNAMIYITREKHKKLLILYLEQYVQQLIYTKLSYTPKQEIEYSQFLN